MFSLQVKPDSKLYQLPPRCVADALQSQELGQLQQDIITQLCMEKTVEWCNSFALVPKSNGKVRLCLDPPMLFKLS